MTCILIWLSMVAAIDTLATVPGDFAMQTLGYRQMDCAGDVNGDGYEDFIYTEGRYYAYPKAYILFGGAIFDNIPDVVLYYSRQGEGRFGQAVGCAGDVNQDGFGDVMVSRCYHDCYDSVYIYYGGDIMDGEPDIIIPNPPQVPQHCEFGHDLCLVDFSFDFYEPDEYPDIVIGCPTRYGQGKVFVYKGPDFVQYVELANPLPYTGYGDELGCAVTAADYNGDTYDEIIAGARYWNSQKGAVVGYNVYGELLYPYYIPWTNTHDFFGHDLTSGDVTNDDIPDLFISVYQYNGRQGQVRVSYGGESWVFGDIANIDQVLEGSTQWDFFGCSIAYCDDIDNDGIGDLIVGASQYEGQNGYVAVYFGDNNELQSDCDTILFGESLWDAFGWQVCDAGDLNSDGFQEFGVSAPFNDAGGAAAGRVYVFGQVNLLSSDQTALAYNGNRHLVRTVRGDDLHLVYTSSNKIFYSYSSNGGTEWSLPEMIGEGRFPAIVLDSENLPSVTWTNEEGGLWYGKKDVTWNVYHLHNPVGNELHLNSPPSMVIIPSEPDDIVHILVTRAGDTPPIGGENYSHTVEDYSFPISQPPQGWFEIIEEGRGPLEPPLRSFPSVTRDFENTLHLVWQRSDTVCYAIKPLNENWDNWGNAFYPQGLRSAHPFVETYGDSIFVVWQHKETSFSKEEVWRARRYLTEQFTGENLSLTPRTLSLYPVNAFGLATTFVDEIYPTPPNGEYEIYWKRIPDDPLHNISNSTPVRSIYPQTALKFDQQADNHLYVVWQEGNEEPYQIKFKREFVPDPPPAFFTSDNGFNIPSPYLVERDTFFSNWTVPVDAGPDSVSYQFRLEPGYFYTLVGVVYHQGTGQWRGRVRLDDLPPFQIAYNACLPETVAVMIPPSLYEDSVLSVTLSRINGSFITVGPIYIYRYEENPVGGGGPLSLRNDFLNEYAVRTWPNPFLQQLNIEFITPGETEIDASIYDVAGRLVKKLHQGIIGSAGVLCWQGVDEMGKMVPQGVYFLRIENPATNTSICRKIIKID